MNGKQRIAIISSCLAIVASCLFPPRTYLASTVVDKEYEGYYANQFGTRRHIYFAFAFEEFNPVLDSTEKIAQVPSLAFPLLILEWLTIAVLGLGATILFSDKRLWQSTK